MSAQKIEKIKEQIQSILFLESEDKLALLSKLENTNEEGLAEIQQILTEAQAKQNEAIRTMVKNDPKFIDELESNFNQIIKSAASEGESAEALEADKILEAL